VNRTYQRAIGWLIAQLLIAPVGSQSPAPDPPQVLFKDLFIAVQRGRIFPDSKEFPDAAPTSRPEQILKQYHLQRPGSPALLKDFVAAHFAVPVQVLTAASLSPEVSIVDHIDGLWDRLTRITPTATPYSSMLALPKPYVVPGGRFREMYYWDSYFTMLGLVESGRSDLALGMVQDFAFLIDAFGRVPNGARTYYLSRSQPPFFFAMVGLISVEGADGRGALAEYLPQLKREYEFWMEGAQGLESGHAQRRVVAMPDGSRLNRYWDDRDTPRDEAYREDLDLARTSPRPASKVYRDIRAAAESGWDFGSRWFADGRTLSTIVTTEIVPVDLNSLLFGLENAIRNGCQQSGDEKCAVEFAQRALDRRGAIDRYLWDAPSGAYLDYRWTRGLPMPHPSAAALYPLFVGLASPAQASAVAGMIARDLLKAGGIRASSLDTGQQWDSPNGWAPLQWIAVSGLRDYGHHALAEAIACRWTVNVIDVYRESGKLVEKYDVVTTGRRGGGGEYPLQDGFGWTNGVERKLAALYPKNLSLRLAQCP
jgi:alpha,alpha-trehalase